MQVTTQPNPEADAAPGQTSMGQAPIGQAPLAETAVGQVDRRGDLVETIPVIQELVRIEKRVVETGRVLVHKTVRETDQPVELLLKQEELSVERVPVGRVVSAAPAIRQDGDVTIIPVLEEVMVVEKRLILKEELHIRRKETERTVRDTVRLRTEEVTVEQHPAPAAIPAPTIEEA